MKDLVKYFTFFECDFEQIQKIENPVKSRFLEFTGFSFYFAFAKIARICVFSIQGEAKYSTKYSTIIAITQS